MQVSNNKRLTWLALAACFGSLFAIGAFLRGESSRPKVHVSVDAVRVTTNQCIVRVTFQNRSENSIEFTGGDFPWDFTGSYVTIALIPEDLFQRQPLNMTPQIYDQPVTIPVVLRHGESRTKEVDLSLFYHDLIPTLKRSRVTMLWSYSAPRISGSLGLVIGRLELEKIVE